MYKKWITKNRMPMTTNGPAIKCENVTRRGHRPPPVNFSQKAVTVQGGYGAVFACRYNFSDLYECRDTMLIESRLEVTLLLFY